MVSAKGGSLRDELSMDATPTMFDTAHVLAAGFAAGGNRCAGLFVLGLRTGGDPGGGLDGGRAERG